jgi:hypothetical protein
VADPAVRHPTRGIVPTSEPDSVADEIIRRHEALVSLRATWEQHWSEIARRVLPRADEFNQRRMEGDRRQEFVFDSTAPLALERFAAAMDSMNTPRTQKWHKLRASQAGLRDSMEVKRYLDAVNDLLFDARYSSRANFASQAHELYMTLGAFGTGIMLLEDDLGIGLRYKAIALAEIYIAENAAGRIDTVHRKFEYTARQAVQKFGKDNLPDEIVASLEKTPDKTFEFIHCLKPSDDLVYGRKDFRGMPFASYYVSKTGKKVVSRGGFRTMPYQVVRYVTSPRETYGRSPAMTVLPDIKMINEMAKTTLRAAHLKVSPPIMLADDGVLQPFQMRPGALNHGMLNEDGSPRAVPFNTGADLPITVELMEPVRRVINDAFLVTLFQILVEKPNMTATEAMLRAQEKGALLGPTGGRIQSEWLGPMIERELDILSAAGALPPMPDEMLEAGGDVEIEYESPLVRAMKAEEAIGILRTLESVTPMAQVDPSILDRFKLSDIPAALGDINGMPSKLILSDEEYAAVKEGKAQAAQAAQLLEAAPVAADAAKAAADVQQKTGVPLF